MIWMLVWLVGSAACLGSYLWCKADLKTPPGDTLAVLVAVLAWPVFFGVAGILWLLQRGRA